MLVFIVLYAYVTFIWTMYKMIEGFIEEKPQPVLVALTYMLVWPLVTVGYICVGIKMFVRHMIREFTGG